MLSLKEFLEGCRFSPHNFASFGLGCLCRSSALGHAGAWGVVTLARRGEIDLEWW